MLRLAALALFAALSFASSASATTFSFDCITGSGSSTNCNIGEAQLALEVTAAGPGQVSFTLSNTGSEDLSAAQLYFDDGLGLLASVVSVVDGSGVDFEEGGTPANLPGGNSYGFDAEYVFSAENPAPFEGVNPGEEVTVVFTLAAGKTLADVLAAIGSENLRVGVHGIAFENGKSKSFINDPVGVPEPAAALLLLAGGAAALAQRRRG